MMENLKVKVNNSDCEIVELFTQYGCRYFDYTCTTRDYAILRNGKVFFCKRKQALLLEDCQEVTIEQLRDMVVLKRNSVDDATHKNRINQIGYLGSDRVEYFWNYDFDEWCIFQSMTFESEQMKPIQNNDLPFIDSEESMKEYLEPMPNGDYRYHIDDGFSIGGDWIEIPDGATMYAEDSNMGIKGNYFFRLRSDGFDYEAIWLNEQWMNAAFDVRNMSILWQRGCESLNDKVASAEVAKQKQPNKKTIDAMIVAEGIINKKHSHYKKDVSQLEFIDVYRVLGLFEVESHAVGHAIKKLLCGGQRGAKDKAQDIQEAIDSLNRELEIMRENESSKD